MTLTNRLAIAMMAVTLCAGAAMAGDTTPPKKELENDYSRADLARYALKLEYKFLPARPSTEFKFPADAGDAIYGIDVSHHNEDGKGPIDWHKLTSQKVVFVYAKATQGADYVDNRFQNTWGALAKLRGEGREVYRGAYHFLSARIDPEKQAQNFLASMGTLSPDDLPPCVDVEWDRTRDGKDRWSEFTEAQIVERVAKFISIVETATGRKPIIYTARGWWNDRIPTTKAFTAYPFWIADYGPRIFASTETPITDLKPRVMKDHDWKLWQFTESAAATEGGLKGRLDANIFTGSLEQFRAAFGLTAPAAPQAPQAPEVPPVPQVPEVPQVPQVPEVPPVAEVPAVPETPQEPAPPPAPEAEPVTPPPPAAQTETVTPPAPPAAPAAAPVQP